MGVELFEPTQQRIRDLVGFPISDSDIAVGANINADKIGTGIVSTTEFNYLDGVTSAIQTQLNAKEPTLGFTPENVANKVTTVGDPGDDTNYPTEQAVREAINAVDPLTTKGDIFTYSTLNARLPVGTNGQLLSADSAEATGLKWIAAGGGGDMILGSAQTNTGIKTFLDTTMKLRNVANTFDGYFVNTNTADRIYTLQDSAGTLAFTSDLTGFFDTAGNGLTSAGSTVNVVGTTNRIDANANDIDISASYVGQASITTLGTITTGVWNGTDIALANIAQIATASILGRVTAATGDIEVLTGTQATTLLDVFTSGLKGLAPASGGGTTNFLRADGTWAAPPGGSQTPWTSDIDADGFDLLDLSNILFRDTTGAPTGTDRAIWYADVTGMNFNALTGDLFDFQVNAVSQMTINATTIDFQGNTLTDILDITSITSLNGVAIGNYALTTDNLSVFAATTSAQLAGVISDETGSGLLVFGTSPTIVTPTIASFANAAHDHENAAGGGQLTATDALDATGTPTSSNFLRGDNTWAVPAGAGDMVLADAQTNSGIKTFLDTTMKLRNVANTFDGYFVNTNTADRIYTLPDAAGTIVITGLANQLTNTELTSGAFAKITGVGTIASGTWEGTAIASAFLDADTMHLSVAQTVNGAKTFLNGNMLLRNVANTFNGVFTNTNTADRTYTLQNADGTIAFLSDITDQTPLTTKGDIFTFTTVDARLPVGTDGFHLVADSAEATGLKWESPGHIDQTPWAQNVDAATFSLLNLGGLELNNPADTFQYVFATSAIVADRTVTLPLLGGNDTFVFEAFAQTLTNKTISAASNTITIASTDLSDSASLARSTDNLGFFAATTSAQLLGVISDETGSGLLVFGTSPTIVTPTIASFVNATHDHESAAGGGALDVAAITTGIFAKARLPGTTVYTDQGNVFGDFTQDFKDDRLRILNPADTFVYTFVASAIVADRNITLPLLTGNDTFVFEAHTQTLTNKTINTASNTITVVAADMTDYASATATFTNKSIDADGTGNVITNIGSSEIKSEMITGFATVTAISGDFILISDTSDAGNLKKVDALDFLGGASQTPWTSDIDADGFDLTDLSNIVFRNSTGVPAAGDRSIHYNDTEGLVYNALTGDVHRFEIQGIAVLTIGDTNVDFNSLNLQEMGILSFADVNTSIQSSASDLQYDVATGNFHTFRINNISEYTFNATEADFVTNNLKFSDATGLRWTEHSSEQRLYYDSGYQGTIIEANSASAGSAPGINFNDTNPSPAGSHVLGFIAFDGDDSAGNPTAYGGMRMDAAVTTNLSESGEFRIYLTEAGTFGVNYIILNEADDAQISLFKDIDLKGNKLIDIGETTITDLATVTAATGDFIWIIDATDGFNKKVNASDFLGAASQTPWTSDIDADGFDLTDLSNIEFRDTTGAPAGTVPAIWVDVNNMRFNVPVNDGFIFLKNAVAQLTIDADVIDVHGNDVNGANQFTFTAATYGFYDLTNIIQYEVPTAGEHRFTINNVTEYSFTATQADFFENNLVNVGVTLQQNNSTGVLQHDFNVDTAIADGTTIGELRFRALDGLSVAQNYARIESEMVIDVDGSEYGDLRFFVMENGTADVEYMQFNVGATERINIFKPLYLPNNNVILWNNSANSQINYQSTVGFSTRLETGDTWNLKVNGTDELTIDATTITTHGNSIATGGGNVSGMPGTFISALTTVTALTGDFIMISDASDSGNLKKVNASDFLGGASQTPWTSNIDADGFHLQDLGAIEFRDPVGTPPGPTINAIYTEAAGIVFNTPTGNNFAFSINDVDEYTFDATAFDLKTNNMKMGTGNQIEWGGSSLRKIANDASGFTLQVETGDTFSLFVNVTGEYTFDATEADWNVNNIINMGNIQFASSTQPASTIQAISADGTGIFYQVPTSDSHFFYQAGTERVRINGSGLSLLNGSGVLSSEFYRFVTGHTPSAGTHEIYITVDDMVFNVATGDGFDLRINDVGEYNFDATQADFNSNNIVNLGTLNTHTVPGGTSTLALLSDLTGFFDTAGTGLTSSGSTVNVIGTASRIVANANDIDIASDYVGQASITTLGTITTGVWNGTAITGANINAASTDLSDSGVIVRTNQTNTFGDFAQIFADNQLFIQNPAATFEYQFIGSAIVADRTITLPLLTGNDTFVFEAFAQTLTNKTIDADNNTVSNIGAAEVKSDIITGQTLKASAVGADEVLLSDSAAAGALKRTTVSQFLADIGQTPWAQNVDAATFSLLNLGGLELNNPADTFQYVFVTSAIAADRNVTLPLLTGADTFVFEAFAQTLTNKTINFANNTLTNVVSTNTNQTITGEKTFGAAADVGKLRLAGSTSGFSILNAAASAGASTITLPQNTSTLLSTVGAFTVTAGSKATFTPSTTVTGLRLLSSGSISSPAAGDIWRNSDVWSFRDNANTAWLEIAFLDSTQTFTNKTIDADATGNVITNIGSSEIKSEMITGFATVTGVSGDFVLISDTSDAGNLKKVDVLDFLGGSSPPFSDSTSIVEGSVDPTKELRFEVDGLTTATVRVITMIDEDLTIVGLTNSQTLTNKTLTTPTIASFANATHDHTNAAGGGQLLSTTALSDTADIAYLNTANTWGDFAQVFLDNILFIQNPAGTFEYQIIASAIAADRTATLPLLTGNDTFVFEAHAQTLTNKTIDANNNTISNLALGAEVTGASTDLTDTANIAYLNTANAWTTGLQDFAAVTMRVPVAAAPTIAVNGDIAIDTTITDFTTPLIRYFGTESMVVIAVPTAEIDTTPGNGDVLAYNATNDEFEFVAASGGSQTPWTSDIDADGFDLNDLSNILFRSTAGAPTATDRSIHYDDTTGMEFNSLTGDLFLFQINNVTEYTFNATEADFLGNNLINFGYLESDATNPASLGQIRLGNTEVIAWRNFANTSDAQLTLNSSNEMAIGGSFLGIQFNNRYIVNASYVESADATPANSGFIRLGSAVTQRISWRNNADTFNNSIRFGTDDSFHIEYDGTDQYVFSATEADFLGNNIVGAGYISFGTTPLATAGVVRMSASDSLAFRNVGDSDNILITGNIAGSYDGLDFSINGVSWYEMGYNVTLAIDAHTFVNTVVTDTTATRAGYHDIGHTADPSSPLTGDMYFNTTSNEYRSYNGSTWDVMKAGAGSQTPWTSDIDADGFDLNDLSNIEFRTTTGAPAGTVQAIYATSAGMFFNVPTGDNFDFQVNGSTRMRVVATGGDSLSIIGGDIDLNGNDITQFINLNSFTAGVTQTGDAAGWTFDVATGDAFSFDINAIPEYTFNATELDLLANNIVNVGYLESNATNPASGGAIRLGNLENLSWRNNANNGNIDITVTSGDILRLSIAGENYLWSNTAFSTGDKDIRLNTGIMSFDVSDNISIQGSTNDLQLDAHTAGVIDLRITNSSEYTFSATQADFNANNLINFGYIESNATNPAGAGAIRLGNLENLSWRNTANTDDIFVTVNSSDQFEFTINSGVEYTIDANGADFLGNYLINFSFLESNATNPASTGEIRLGNAENIAWRNAANSADIFMRIGTSDELILTGSSLIALDDSTELRWAGNANRRILNDTAGFIFEVDTSDSFLFQIGSSTKVQLLTTELSLLGGVNLNLSAGAQILADSDATSAAYNDAGHTADPSSPTLGDMYFNTTANEFRSYNGSTWDVMKAGGGSQTPWTSDIDADGFDLTDLSNIVFRTTTAAPTGTDRAIWYDDVNGMEFNALTGDDFRFNVNDAVKVRIDTNEFVLSSGVNVSLADASYLRWATSSQRQITNDTGGFTFDVPSADTFEYNIATVLEYSFSATQADFNANNLINFGYLESNATNPASAGQLRLGFLESLEWRNFGNTNNIAITGGVSTQYDGFEFSINGTVQMEIGSANATINAPNWKIQEAGVDISPIGLHEQGFDAGNLLPTTTGGASAWTSEELGTGGNVKEVGYVQFANAATNSVTLKLELPNNYNNGTIQVRLYWYAPTSASGNVRWEIKGVALGNSDLISTAYGTAVAFTDTGVATANDLVVGGLSGAITLGNTPADNDFIFINISRLGADAGDTLTDVCRLIGGKVQITTDAAVAA